MLMAMAESATAAAAVAEIGGTKKMLMYNKQAKACVANL